ncbi:WXG100 family type VII secretion target [Streptomyces sp. NPDC001351]|uniref:WXG100 family type VII secretion target n=1 Tax=Streptomyces sp. NPDC001351 TaxID=3364564 RepID=UPI0036A939F0
MSDSYATIEGDRSTLYSSGQDLASACSELVEITHVLNTRVRDLVNDAGWSGDAADNFKQDWLVSSAASDAIIQAMGHISTTMEHLAVVLGEAQNDLDDARDYAKKHGIPLDPDGHPLPVTMDISEYVARADAAVQKAKRARSDAAQSFAAIVSQLAPGGSDNTLGTSDNVTLADAARTLYGIPAARAALSREKMERLNQERVDMKRLHRHMPKQSREWKEFQTERLANRRALREANKILADVEKSTSKWKFSGKTEFEFSRLREKLNLDGQFKILDSIPILGTTVGLAGIYLASKDDMEKGWGFWHSVGVETGSTALSMAAGAAIEAGAAESVPVAVTVGASLGVGYVAGTYGDELVKAGHWEHNIHTHGVVSGIGHSIGDASATWWKEDFKGMGDKIKNSTVDLWNDVF